MPESKGLRESANVTELDIELAFEGFKTLRDPELEKALEAAKTFCRDMASADKPSRWITFLGPSGVGKTMLLRGIVRFFILNIDFLPDERSGPNERWIRRGGAKHWPTAISEMQGGDFSGLMLLKRDWFAALDDIGAERSGSDFSVSKLYEVLNSREGLFTAITANLPLESISEKMDTRIGSRLLRNNSMLINVNTIDFNQR